MNQLRAHSRRFREWISACQSKLFGRPSLTPLPPPGRRSEARRWNYLAMIIKTVLVLVVLTRRYVKRWKDKARLQDWPGKGLKIVVFLIYLAVVALYIWLFTTFFIDLAWFSGLVDQHSWGFGQIVAITVWAGPLCEYIHLELRE